MLPEVIRLLSEKGIRVRLPLEELKVLNEKEDDQSSPDKKEETFMEED